MNLKKENDAGAESAKFSPLKEIIWPKNEASFIIVRQGVEIIVVMKELSYPHTYLDPE